MMVILKKEVVELSLDKIKVSSRTTHLFGMLKSTTGIGSEVWARISFCLSIKQKGIPNPDEHNTDGTEFLASKLFSNDEKIYLALILNRLKQDRLDPDTYLVDMTRAHINRGAIALKQRISSLFDVYGFMEEMDIVLNIKNG